MPNVPASLPEGSDFNSTAAAPQNLENCALWISIEHDSAGGLSTHYRVPSDDNRLNDIYAMQMILSELSGCASRAQYYIELDPCGINEFIRLLRSYRQTCSEENINDCIETFHRICEHFESEGFSIDYSIKKWDSALTKSAFLTKKPVESATTGSETVQDATQQSNSFFRNASASVGTQTDFNHGLN